MGLREPIVVILLLTAFFTTIPGRPVNGLLLLIVAIGLAWDAARNRRRMAAPPSAGTPAGAAPAGPSQGEPGPGLLAPRRGPLRPRPDPGKLPVPGAVLWAGLLVAAGVWELVALFLEPSLTTTSYAHRPSAR